MGCSFKSQLKKLLKVDIKAVHGDPRPGDIKDSLADVSLAKELIGYEPKILVDEGLKRTVEWFLQNKHVLGL